MDDNSCKNESKAKANKINTQEYLNSYKEHPEVPSQTVDTTLPLNDVSIENMEGIVLTGSDMELSDVEIDGLPSKLKQSSEDSKRRREIEKAIESAKDPEETESNGRMEILKIPTYNEGSVPTYIRFHRPPSLDETKENIQERINLLEVKVQQESKEIESFNHRREDLSRQRAKLVEKVHKLLQEYKPRNK